MEEVHELLETIIHNRDSFSNSTRKAINYFTRLYQKQTVYN